MFHIFSHFWFIPLNKRSSVLDTKYYFCLKAEGNNFENSVAKTNNYGGFYFFPSVYFLPMLNPVSLICISRFSPVSPYSWLFNAARKLRCQKK